MTVKTQLTIDDLDRVVLQSGSHSRRGYQSVCVMELYAWLIGHKHTDHPPCSTVIGDFLRSWNDAMNQEDRQQLLTVVPRLIGVMVTPELKLQRSWMALDWYCRVSAPAWLRLAGLIVEAEAIEATAPITDSASALAAQDALNQARKKAYIAWDAARDAARAAALVAARAAALVAAWDAAWDAARDAARAAAGDKLRPTVVILQQSALALVERMCDLGRETTDATA